MALNTSGAISLGGGTAGQSINLALGQAATAQVSLGDANVRALAGVASGAIAMPTNFYGQGSTVYRLDAGDYVDNGITGQDPAASVDFTVRSDGVVTILRTVNGSLPSYNWSTPTTGSTTRFVRATLLSGSFTAGTTGSWLALTSDRNWRVRIISSGFRQASASFQIATDSGGTNIVATATVILSAELV